MGGHRIKNYLVSIFVIAFGTSPYASATVWPDPDWAISNQTDLNSPQCRAFTDVMFHSKLNTDGLLVVKDGQIQYERYAGGFKSDTSHVLWSITKTITGAILGAAVQDGRVRLDQKVSDFFVREKPNDNYEKIKLENLFYFDSGFRWNETYEGDVRRSPLFTMLFGAGRKDMAQFAATQEVINEGPGYAFEYSTGTATLTMGVLKKVYGTDYDQMPWQKLFDPIGMKSVVFEQDANKTFIGGAAAFATPRDLARLGYLFLNNGRWDGRQILPEDWLEKTLTPSPGYVSEGTSIKNVTAEGVFAGSVWLNREVKPNLGRPYPNSPDDMYMAFGHFGQFLFMLPSQNMILVRTGNDLDYNSHVDEFVSKAIACFVDPTYHTGQVISVPPYHSKFKDRIRTARTGIRYNYLQAAVAKAVCSCHFISGLPTDDCAKRSRIPGARALNFIEVDEAKGVVTATPSGLADLIGLHVGKPESATYDYNNPQLGCLLK